MEALLKIAASRSGCVLSKSATLLKQDGNPMPRFVNKIALGKYCEGSINAEGLPNQGIGYCKPLCLHLSNSFVRFQLTHMHADVDADTVNQIAETGKPYMVSISGLSVEDNLAMLDQIYATPHVAAVEVNFACPNIPGKPMLAYDLGQMEAALERICAHRLHGTVPMGIKLAPYFDMPHFEQVIKIISKFSINFIVSINTIGNGLVVDADSECEALAARSGLGGLGGGFVKHTALANVRQFYKLLKQYDREDIDIIGVGGVQSGLDAFELILCGAKAVQVGTCHWTEGPGCFERITRELEGIMKKKGYREIADFRGKLKPYCKTANKPHFSLIDDGRPGPSTMLNILVSVILVLAAIILHLFQQVQRCSH